MKLLVSIINWHCSTRDRYLTQILKEYERLLKDDFQVQVVIYRPPLTDQKPRIPRFTKFPYRFVKAEQYTGTDFTWSGRKDVIKAVDDYDLFLYTDDDVLVRRKSILAFIEETRRLPERFIASFNIAEQYRKTWYALNHHREWPTADALYDIGGRPYYVQRNRHWAGFLCTSQQLRKAIRSGNFATEPTAKEEYGMRAQEWAMSNIYFKNECGMLPVVPLDDLNTFKSEHLDKRYARSGNFLALEEVRERALELQIRKIL
jgi:hypothetical protein